MKLKSVIDSPTGLRYCFDNLEIQSGYARRYLLDSDMLLTKEDIQESYAEVKFYYDLYVANQENWYKLQKLQFRLQTIKDIRGTIGRLKGAATLDDIELFEVKHLALLANRVLEGGILEDVINLLDPDGLRIQSFYIYDSYSPELASLRSQIECMEDGNEKEELRAKLNSLEYKIREGLSTSLLPYSETLLGALESLAKMDIAVAKALQMKNLSLIFPDFSEDGITTFNGLFNPKVEEALKGVGKKFQKIDISYGKIPTLIIGANMGGKTVVMKSLALCQYLFQFGFGIPASFAQLAIVKEVFLCIGDGQNESEGLSSFSYEMLNIDRIIKASKVDHSIAAFIDEPARSTNPIEGTALVASLTSLLNGRINNLVITTHYSIEESICKLLKVRGLVDGKMDYSLEETRFGVVPNEALNVAESLGIDTEWIETARKLLKH